jgi:putative endonuclease
MLCRVISLLQQWSSKLFRRSHYSTPKHLIAGEWGEKIAGRFLEKKNYRILGRRVIPCGRDELDIIARSPEDVLVFVEVKTRADESFGRPFASIDRRKRKALSRAALRYLLRLKSKPPFFRFDVIEVIGVPEQKSPEIRHIENAFPLEGKKRIPW